MRRGVSSGGGQSSLNYLFGSGEAPKPAATDNAPAANPSAGQPAVKDVPPTKPVANPQPVEVSNIPAGVNRNPNNYQRADGQNTGNFITVLLQP